MTEDRTPTEAPEEPRTMTPTEAVVHAARSLLTMPGVVFASDPKARPMFARAVVERVLGEPLERLDGPSEPAGKPRYYVTLTVPLPDGEDVWIEGRFPMVDAEWDLFMRVLASMKPGLVR